MGWKTEKPQTFLGIEPQFLGPQSHILIDTVTEISRLLVHYKGKLHLEQALKAQRGSRGIDLLFL
jgi:hypothetical protein